MTHRIHPLNSSPVGSGRVHAPGTGQTQGPRGPQGPNPTHPKTLERIGPLAGLVGRGVRPAKEADTRRAELPRSRDSGSRSWMSSMKQAASKTSHAISHGFNKAGHVLNKINLGLNDHSEPSWMANMSAADRAHYDYYGELPTESSRPSYVAAPWEQPEPSPAPQQRHGRQPVASPEPGYVAAPWERPAQQAERTEVRTRPMTDAEQVEENAAAAYHGYQPASTIEERVSRPASEPFARASSNSSPGSVRTRPMTPTEQAHENAAARYHNEQPRTTIDEFVPSRPSSPPRSGRANRDALLTNIRETVPRMNLNRVDHAEPREFVQLALNLTKGTAYEKGMHKLAQTDPALGAGMKERWGALREHLDGLRAQGKENVPRLEWLFENRPSRMMDFLVGGRGGSKLVRPTTQG